MAKKKNHNYKKKKFNFGSLIKGNFLNREEVRLYYRYAGLLMVMMVFMIYINNLANNKVKQINALKEKTEEYKSRNAYAQSKLIKIKLESQLGKAVIKDSLVPLENHPHKILVKIDSIHEK
ncbi:FtsL-like putative cell division protein [Riemerella columbina]|uniref:FtsL-like putative cell division protein n=1 Tax=Riemerella columbina TaxID=103810 RepID=UPI00266F65C8|nr:FtsL-like putative cell division protein [Riemerella columbina]WKS95371.1 FtsL-like putative cell division protein [Riemerella columbina]